MRSKVETAADARLEEAALLLEEMARQLRGLKEKRAKVPEKKQRSEVPEDVPSTGVADELRVGCRVQVVRKDKYRGRKGVVLSRRGRLFWNVQLDGGDACGECVIFKKDTSLRVLGTFQGR
jgi:hypothetical protein